MTVFIISLVGSFLLSTLVFGTVTWIRNEEKPLKVKLFKTITAVVVMSLIMSFFFTCYHLGETDEWNDGKCSTCNVEWDFEGADRGRNSKTYYYECPSCHDVITQNNLH